MIDAAWRSTLHNLENLRVLTSLSDWYAQDSSDGYCMTCGIRNVNGFDACELCDELERRSIKSNDTPAWKYYSGINYCIHCGTILTDRDLVVDSQSHPFGSTTAREYFLDGYRCHKCGYIHRF